MQIQRQFWTRVILLAVLPVWIGLIVLALTAPVEAVPRFVLWLLVPIAGGGWTALCWFAFRRFFDPSQREILQAGEWALQRALGRRPRLGRAEDPQSAALLRNLDDWLKGLIEEMQQRQKAQAEEIQRDLVLARDFQMAYMNRPYPSIPPVHVPGHLRLSFAHVYQPASMLGGDFFNILPLGPDCAGIFVADVMGHGTQSALVTAMIRTLTDDLSSIGRNARHFMKELNKEFCALLSSVPGTLFASAFYFVADITSRVATFSSAGHPAPLYAHRELGRLQRVDVPMPRGAALGLLATEEYTAGHCRLNSGDLFIFYTDGVIEAHDPSGDEFGIERLEKVIQQWMYHPAQVVLNKIRDAVLEFSGDQPIADDICLVAVEVSDKPVERKAEVRP